MHLSEISFKLVPLSMVSPPRVSENDCCPVPMSTANALAPACALNDLRLLPELTSTVPESFNKATTKTESATSSAPLGTPWK